jgi:membrane protease YdiL (CAAX protease family)
VLGVVLYAAAQHLATYVYLLFLGVPAFAGATTLGRVVVYWARDIILLALAWSAYATLPNAARPDIGWRGCALYWYIIAIVAGLVLVVANLSILELFRRVGLRPHDLFAGFSTAPRAMQIALAIDVAILSPILQELAFRGWLFSSLRRVLPLAAAIAISSLSFGLIHISLGLPAVTYTTLGGIAFAVLFERSRSLAPCALAHVVVNTAAAIFWLQATFR